MPSPKIKLIFFGSAPVSIFALSNLLETGFEIVGVVSKPAKKKGRQQKLTDNELTIASEKLGLNIILPEKFDQRITDQIIKLKPDIFVVVAYGKIIPAELLQIPKFGTINLHPSLLPKFRGASPIQTAIFQGEKITGITVMLLDELIDHGPILNQKKLEIESDDTYQSLGEKLFKIGSEILPTTISDYLTNRIKPTAQNHNLATFTKLLSKGDGLIDWEKEANSISRQIRGFYPWPGTYTYCKGKMFKIISVKEKSGILQPGQIKFDKINRQIFVGCKKNILEIKKIQPAGKAVLRPEQFITGYNLDGLFFSTNPET